MKLFLLFLFVTFVKCDELGSLIDEVFGPAKNTDASRNVGDNQVESNGDCTCVPYYLCANNTVVTDGVGLIDIRGGSESQCPNYLDVCCQSPLDRHQALKPTPVPRSGCGKRNPEGVGFRITGDENDEAQYGEFPWMVAVLKEEDVDGQTLNIYQCGGSLIHPQVVITAAHCVSKNSHYKVRAGEWDTQTNNELYPHVDINVETITIHPDYYAGALYNDVALLFLEAPYTLAENIDVVCMPQQDESYDYSKCFASGWGKDVFGKEGRYQVILKKVEIPIVPHGQCQDLLRSTRLGPYFNLHSSFVCAGGEAGRDTCKGDGGSPLVCPVSSSPKKYAQVGIVAWGIGCGENNIPGVYVNIPRFRNWIDKQLVYKKLDPSPYEY